MLSRYARGINTTRITAAFTFNDLLHHLPTLAWITVTNVAIRVSCLPLFFLQNTHFEEDERAVVQIVLLLKRNKGACYPINNN